MGTKEKLIARFSALPNDFTWEEMRRLLVALGYVPGNKGKTSGSRVIFKGEGKKPIMLHKPHPGNIIKGYVMKQVYDYLKKRRTDMNTLKYKDFIGSVAFSEADGVFFGKIEGIDGLVNFEGESVAELTNAFHEAVDDYLAYCAEEGIEPHKSYSGSLNVRLTPDIHTRVAYLAKQAGVSINSFIRTAVEKQIAAML